MKAGIIVAVGVAIGVALWAGGSLKPVASEILISNASATPMPNGTIVATLTIENQGTPDRLVGVSSTLSSAHFHDGSLGLPVPIGTSSLASDSAHIMIMPPETPVEDGTLIPIALQFETAGEVRLKARLSTPEPGSMAAHDAMGHGAMVLEIVEAPFPAVSVSAVPQGDGWMVQIDVQNFNFSEAMQDEEHVPGTGHGHVYLGGIKLGRVFDKTYDIGPLPPGQHRLRVSLNTNDHRTLSTNGKPVVAETIIEVD